VLGGVLTDMRRLWMTAVLLGTVSAVVLPATSSASCIGPLTAKQYEKRADVIFIGVALEGPTSTGIQRFRVERYLKGTGPETARVSTGVEARSDGTGMTTSVSVDVSEGERWQIYARSRPGSEVLETNQCDGSGKLASGGGEATPIQDSPAGASSGGDDRTEALLLALGLAALAVFSVALVVRRRFRRPASSPGV
jgi:hypothetical protein